MKDFKKFLEEITIKGNPGIPGQGGRKNRQREDSDYLSDSERDAKRRLGLTGRERPQEIGGRMMQLIGASQRFIRGKEEELEELAKQIIQSNYGDILDGVELDIKLVRSGEVAEFIEDEGCDGGDCDLPKFQEIKDEELQNKIHRAKISNNIIQGEAKNTKHILHTEEVKDGLKEIYGEEDAKTVFEMWDEISKLADKMDWIIPIRMKADMMEQAPEGMAGAVSVDWNEKDDNNEEVAKNLIDDMSNVEDFNKEDVEDFQELVEDTNPVIRARGVDFPMLLHETVKGIYELIASIALPPVGASEDQIKEAETIQMNVSSFEDEAEDFRTGPEIAADFRNFINENPDADQNTRAYVFGKMLEELSSEDFLKLFRGILNKTDAARTEVDAMISEINAQLRAYDLGDVLDDDVPEYEKEEEPTYEAPKKDVSDLPKREIQTLIDNALDDGDFEEVKRLSQYLKEGKEIYLKELEMIKENHQYHKK